MLLPDIVTIVGVSVAVSAVEFTVAVRLTTPLNPPRDEMLIWTLPDVGIMIEDGTAVIVKSGVVTTSVIRAVGCDSPPFVPVTVTV